MIHPEYILKPEQKEEIAIYDPAYSLTQGLSNRYVSSCIKNSLKFFPILGCLKKIGLPCTNRLIMLIQSSKGASIMRRTPAVNRDISSIALIFVLFFFNSYVFFTNGDSHHLANSVLVYVYERL